MKKQISILTTAIFMMAMSAYATVWRVNNRPYVDADFTTLQAAIDGASAGDTLYIEGSTTSYGNGTFDKQLAVIGPGYWLDQNDSTQAYKQHAQVGQLVFDPGSDGSFISGLYIYYTSWDNFRLINIKTNNITILKNYIYAFLDYDGSNRSGIAIGIVNSVSEINITQNWINARVKSTSDANSVYGIYIEGIPVNFSVANNIIRAYRDIKSSYYAIYMSTNNLTNDLIVNNNVMWGSIVTYHTFLVNNILVSGTYNNSADDQTANNLCNGTQFPDINNNLLNVDMTTVFVEYDKYIDNGYILAAGSPATGAGINGGDCGVFSYDYGSNPYVLSGIPAIPAIFEADVSATVGSVSLPVNIKAMSHNENK